MRYQDEYIIKARKREARKRYSSLETGIYVGDKLYTFEQQSLFQDAIKLYLPQQLEIMEEDLAKRYFPFEKRPDIILTEKDQTVVIGFKYLEQQDGSLNGRDMIGEFYEVIHQTNPQSMLVDIGEINGCGWCEFKNTNFDGTIYTFFLAKGAGRRLLLGTVTCPFQYGAEWGMIARKMVESIFITKEGTK